MTDNDCTAAEAPIFPAFRLDRNELAGAFGGIGTDLPLLIGMTVAAGLKGAGVLIMFGVMQVVTGALYRMPMPVQPLKAMAAIVIAQHLSGETLFGAGLAIGVVMLVLAVTGLADRRNRDHRRRGVRRRGASPRRRL